MSFTSVRKIRFDDVDGAGIVYYPQFFHICHEVFEDFFDEVAQRSYPQMITVDRLGFPTVAIESQFTAPLKYGDLAVVQMNVLSIGTSSLKMRYEFYRKEDGEKSFYADITTVLMNLDTHQAQPLPETYIAIFKNYLIKT
jgi:YbgC/YbaW family acyl-CoA thioester hydrolase